MQATFDLPQHQQQTDCQSRFSTRQTIRPSASRFLVCPLRVKSRTPTTYSQEHSRYKQASNKLCGSRVFNIIVLFARASHYPSRVQLPCSTSTTRRWTKSSRALPEVLIRPTQKSQPALQLALLLLLDARFAPKATKRRDF
jgi:hypothetical protein